MKKNLEPIPLNAYLARAGVASRRATVEIIKKGQVTVNDELITEPGFKVLPTDVVKYKDRIIKEEKKVYILLNKPKGYITTVSDERGRKTVMELVQSATRERLFPIGRLDRDTTGLIVITNDGNFAQKLAHPSKKVPKKYYVVVDRPLQGEDLQKLKNGVVLEDGRAKVDKIYFLQDKKRNIVMVEIHGGKKRVVKRMFTAIGYKVIGLDRVGFATLTKKGLKVGQWRYLTDEEIKELTRSK